MFIYAAMHIMIVDSKHILYVDIVTLLSLVFTFIFFIY